MNIHETIELLDRQISNPSSGLPEDIFLFITRLTPMVNVDLLIKDENRRTLLSCLSWRDDAFSTGWHVPGGIIRFKEDMKTRIKKVAETEIGADVQFEPVPIAINQIISDHDTRGHFISILYKCFLSNKFIPKNTGLSKTDVGYLMWHDSCPENMVKVHEMYRKYI